MDLNSIFVIIFVIISINQNIGAKEVYSLYQIHFRGWPNEGIFMLITNLFFYYAK